MASSDKHETNAFVFRNLADGSSGSSGSDSSSSGSGSSGSGSSSGSSSSGSGGHNISEDRPQARAGTARDVRCLA